MPLGVAEEGKAKVASFQAYLPLIAAICNNGLRERHWVAIADVVGFEIKKDEVGCWLDKSLCALSPFAALCFAGSCLLLFCNRMFRCKVVWYCCQCFWRQLIPVIQQL
jgi:hypothetical protein